MASFGRNGVKFEDGFCFSETPRFIKVMFEEILEQGRIAIPPRFIRKYGDQLSESVVLKVPSDEPFEVSLEEAEGSVWLDKGWKKFQDYYSLKVGAFLLFELEGNGVFNVLIFDRTCTEVPYPVNGSQDRHSHLTDEVPSSEREESDDDSPVEVSDASSDPEPPSCKLPIEVSDDSSSYSPSMHSESESETESEMKLELVAENSKRSSKRRIARPQKHLQRNRSPRSSAKKPRIVHKPLPPTSHLALQAAKRYRPQYPAFRVRLRPSYMRSGGISICAEFMRKHEFKTGESAVKLKHNGDSWPVKMFCYQKEHRGKLCSGWGKFLEDNSLDNGDVCIFELLNKTEFRVRFFRCSDYR